VTLGSIFYNTFGKHPFGAFSVFSYQSFGYYWSQENPNSILVHHRKILTTKVGGNERFFSYSKSCQILILTTFWEIDCCAT
jgi:hypothetical protein